MIRALILTLLLAAPAHAQSRDAVFQTLWAAVNGTVAGHVYGQPGSISGSQDWACQTCGAGQRIRIGWYDYAYNYASDDPAFVLDRITGACQFNPCTNAPYAAHGYQGLIQYGQHRRGPSARTYLIVGDRLWSLYANGAPSVAGARARAVEAENILLPLILAAHP